MNTFSKSLVALMVASAMISGGAAFAGEKKHSKKHDHAAKAEQAQAPAKAAPAPAATAAEKAPDTKK